MAKSKPTPPEPTPQPEPQLPLLQTLALFNLPKDGYIPVRVFTRGAACLGFEPLTKIERPHVSIVYDVLAIHAMKLYGNRQGFGSDVDVATLRRDLPETFHTMGIARLPTGLYSPVSLKIEAGRVTASALLFSSALGLFDAVSVFKAKFRSFFVDRKVFIT